MREIKFRAWVASKMFTVAEILFESDRIHLGDKGNFGVPLSQVKLMQYTGLKDKNGKEIYEGDVVAVPTYPFDPSNGDDPITFLPVTFEYGIYRIGDDYICDLDLSNEVEVIGNIYENPELLA
jgi:uncharacterized phage protein (TIGR01671 family)